MSNSRLGDDVDDNIVSKWAGRWWNWYLSDNPRNNRIVDDALFLNGWPHENETSLKIYSDTGIFFPIIDSMYTLPDETFADRDLEDRILKTELDIKNAISRESAEARYKVAYIVQPNSPIQPLGWKRVHDCSFNLKVPTKCTVKTYLENRLPPKDGYKAISGGYYTFIKSLEPSPDPYRIHFEAMGLEGYKTNGTFDISVQEKK